MKHYIKSTITGTLLFLTLISCKKAGSAETTKIAPTNLVISSVVAGDGSGTVAFTATAVNAVSYDYEFGNGEVRTVPTGITSYTYALTGTNTFSVSVTAKSSAGLTLKKSVPV